MRYKNSGLVLLAGLVCLLCSIPQLVRASDYSYARVVRVSFVQGDVQMAQPSQQGWEKAVINLPVQQGDTVATGLGARSEIEFENGSTARIAGNSTLQFTELALAEGGRLTKLTLTQGTTTFYVSPGSQDTFSVLTPNLQIAASGNARFRVDVTSDATSVSVFKGDVQIDSPAGTRRVEHGNTLSYSTAHPSDAQIQPNDRPDDWDRWVMERQGVTDVEHDNTYRYAQAPFSYGLNDLAMHGGWSYFPSFGYGWQPWGLTAGWMPFMQGFWQFLPGFGWTWVSYEPWGWVPYHFGRWAFISGFGWTWFPGYYGNWCPATAYWVQTRTGLGWAPLPPRTTVGHVPPRKDRHTVVVANTLDGVKKRSGNGIVDLSEGSRVQVRGVPPDVNGSFAGNGHAGAGARSGASGSGNSVPMVSSLRDLRQRSEDQGRGVSDTLVFFKSRNASRTGSNAPGSPAAPNSKPPVRSSSPAGRDEAPHVAPHPTPAPAPARPRPHTSTSMVNPQETPATPSAAIEDLLLTPIAALRLAPEHVPALSLAPSQPAALPLAQIQAPPPMHIQALSVPRIVSPPAQTQPVFSPAAAAGPLAPASPLAPAPASHPVVRPH